ncbi:AAA family ATPase [Streptomyces sp. NPDC094049]|uniref:ATP-binding protein n=1 Tax=Streptomyces sp. NPDC094049 TaxID=3154987 RepID=UPI00332199B8
MKYPKVWTHGDDCGAGRGGPSPERGGLLGRSGEVAELRAALTGHRQVTVTGAAGVGKSRLALAVAAPPGTGPWRTVVRVRWHDGVPVGPGALTARVTRALTAATGVPPEAEAEAEAEAGADTGLERASCPSPDRGRDTGRDTGPGAGAASRADTGAGARTGRAPDTDASTGTGSDTGTSAGTGDVLAAALAATARGRLLLVLDDVDPVRVECAGLVQRLLMDVPALRVLVTARRALGLGDERVLRLSPLAVDPCAGAPGPAPAVALFLARAPGGAEWDEAGLADVTRVCRMLEGVPLAIELAAGQVGGRTVRELAARLEADQCWLTGPGPLLRRHRSLRASIGAVHALCEPAARKVWRRASVFAGAFSESAAVHLCAGDGVEPEEVPACLALLGAKGVLRVIGEPGAVRVPRYRMARAARDFGAERLRGAGESPDLLTRHAIHYRGVAAVAETLWHTGLQRQAVQIVLDEHDDLMAVARGGRPAPSAPARRRGGPDATPEPDRGPVPSEHEDPPDRPSHPKSSHHLDHLGDPNHPDRPDPADQTGPADRWTQPGSSAQPQTDTSYTLDDPAASDRPDHSDHPGSPNSPQGPDGRAHPDGPDRPDTSDRSARSDHAEPPCETACPAWPHRHSHGADDPEPALPSAFSVPAAQIERTEAAVESVLHLWFWWAVHGRGTEGGALLLGLLPRLPSASPLVARGRGLAAWLVAAHDPRTAHRLVELVWPAAVLAGDDALVGRVAHVQGTLAWQRRDLEAAARYYRLAADTVPERAYGGPPPSVSLAALSVVEAHTSPEAAVRTAERALARPTGCDDLWSAALAQYARAFAEHRAGRSGRAGHRTRRALARLAREPGAAPQARHALRLLLDHIESGEGTGPAGRFPDGSHTPPDFRRRPFVPMPRAGPPSAQTAEDGAGRS